MSDLPDPVKLQAAREAALSVEARGDDAVTVLANKLLGTPEEQATRLERRKRIGKPLGVEVLLNDPVLDRLALVRPGDAERNEARG